MFSSKDRAMHSALHCYKYEYDREICLALTYEYFLKSSIFFIFSFEDYIDIYLGK